jgi:hypothetical protein
VRSAQLSNDVDNLMLLCYVHHKLIDVDQVDEHPEERLKAMKAAHERRIEIVTAIDESRASYILRYAANIGAHESPVAYEHVSIACRSLSAAPRAEGMALACRWSTDRVSHAPA